MQGVFIVRLVHTKAHALMEAAQKKVAWAEDSAVASACTTVLCSKQGAGYNFFSTRAAAATQLGYCTRAAADVDSWDPAPAWAGTTVLCREQMQGVFIVRLVHTKAHA
jgi:hypothetical protein